MQNTKRILSLLKDPVFFFSFLKKKIQLYKERKKNPFFWNAYIWKYCGVRMGEDCIIFESADILSEHYLVEMGNNVIVTGGVKLLTHDGASMLFRKEIGNCEVYGRIIIGNNVFIGMNSMILPNVRIGSNVIIGAGSVVRHDVPDNSVVMGNPAKVIFKMSMAKKFIVNDKNLIVNKKEFDEKTFDRRQFDEAELASVLFQHFDLDINDFHDSFRDRQIIKVE